MGEHDRQTQTRRNSFMALLYVTAWTFATLYAPQPLLSTIQGHFPQHGNTTAALLMTVTLAPLCVAPLVYGAILSSLDTRRVLLVCVLLMAASGIGMFLAPTFEGLLACRLLLGSVIPAVLTCLMAHISAQFQGAALQRAMSIYIGVSILGGLLGRIGAGVIASALGWRAVFLVFSIALGAALVPLWRLKSETHTGFARVRLKEFAAIMRTPGMASLLFIEHCGMFVFLAVTNFLPFRLTEVGPDIAEWRISLLYAGYGLGALLAFNSYRILALLGGEVRGIRVGILMTLCALPGFWIDGLWPIFLTMCLVCSGQFLAHSISPGLINRTAPQDKGAVNGLYLSIYYLGGVFGSFAPGLIYVSYGWTPFIATLMGVLVLALMCTLRLPVWHRHSGLSEKR